MSNSIRSPMQHLFWLTRRGAVVVAEGFGWLLLAVVWVWACSAVWLFRPLPHAVAVSLALLWMCLTIGLLIKLPRRKAAGCVAGGVLLIWGVWWLQPARNDRSWGPDQTRLPEVLIEGDRVVIENVRCATYRSEDDYDVVWERRTLDLRQLESVDLVMVSFSAVRALAHVFVTFGFRGGEHLAISAEVRRARGESYSVIEGLFHRYELMYVVGDESDLIGLRANIHRCPVYVYPMKVRKDQVRRLLVSMLARAERLRTAPEFYNSVTNSCSTNLHWHVNQVRQRPVWWNWCVLLPGFSDERAFELGLIDFAGSLEQARTRFCIEGRTMPWTTGKHWSEQIRRPSAGPTASRG